jgi:hypothetical protein
MRRGSPLSSPPTAPLPSLPAGILRLLDEPILLDTSISPNSQKGCSQRPPASPLNEPSSLELSRPSQSQRDHLPTPPPSITSSLLNEESPCSSDGARYSNEPDKPFNTLTELPLYHAAFFDSTVNSAASSADPADSYSFLLPLSPTSLERTTMHFRKDSLSEFSDLFTRSTFPKQFNPSNRRRASTTIPQFEHNDNASFIILNENEDRRSLSTSSASSDGHSGPCSILRTVTSGASRPHNRNSTRLLRFEESVSSSPPIPIFSKEFDQIPSPIRTSYMDLPSIIPLAPKSKLYPIKRFWREARKKFAAVGTKLAVRFT